MEHNELMNFLKYVIGIIATVLVIAMILQSGFMLTKFNVNYKSFNIEVIGNEKSTQPR